MWQLIAVPVALLVYYEMIKTPAKPPIDLGKPAPPKRPGSPPVAPTASLPAATPAGNPVIPVIVGPMQPRLTVNPVSGLPVVNLGAPIIPGQPTLVSTLQANGIAVATAHALHDFLKDGSKTGAQYAGSHDKVLAFQTAAMSDPTAIALGGPLKLDGLFDQTTSAALTMYTGDPIPADPTLAAPVLPFNIATAIDTPGPAAMASFNLKMYYKTHSHNKTNPDEVAFVKAFQSAVNTDPSTPGPSSKLGIKLVTVPLLVDGDFGPVPSRPIGAGESITAAAYRKLFGGLITDP